MCIFVSSRFINSPGFLPGEAQVRSMQVSSA
jgi:hypothetical protein